MLTSDGSQILIPVLTFMWKKQQPLWCVKLTGFLSLPLMKASKLCLLTFKHECCLNEPATAVLCVDGSQQVQQLRAFRWAEEALLPKKNRKVKPEITQIPAVTLRRYKVMFKVTSAIFLLHSDVHFNLQRLIFPMSAWRRAADGWFGFCHVFLTELWLRVSINVDWVQNLKGSSVKWTDCLEGICNTTSWSDRSNE